MSGSTPNRSPSRMAISVLCRPCSRGTPIPRSVANDSTAITSAARTRSAPGDATSATIRSSCPARSSLLCANLATGGPRLRYFVVPPPAMAIVLAARLTYGERATRYSWHSRSADERGTVTADPAGQELTIGERVDFTRAHLPATQRERYEQQLRQATEQARWTRATTARSARRSSDGGGRRGWRTAAGPPGSGRSAWPRRAAGTSCSPARAATSMRSSRSCSAEQAPLSDRAEPQHSLRWPRLSPKAKRWLAELYQIMAVT